MPTHIIENLYFLKYKPYHASGIVSALVLVGASLSEPHINVKFVRLVCLSFRLSVCPYVHNTKIYKSSSNLQGTFSC